MDILVIVPFGGLGYAPFSLSPQYIWLSLLFSLAHSHGYFTFPLPLLFLFMMVRPPSALLSSALAIAVQGA
jgi:hypothetical protein